MLAGFQFLDPHFFHMYFSGFLKALAVPDFLDGLDVNISYKVGLHFVVAAEHDVAIGAYHQALKQNRTGEVLYVINVLVVVQIIYEGI